MLSPYVHHELWIYKRFIKLVSINCKNWLLQYNIKSLTVLNRGSNEKLKDYLQSDPKFRNIQKITILNNEYINDSSIEILSQLVCLDSMALYNCPFITDIGLKWLQSLSRLDNLSIANCNNIRYNNLIHLTKLTYLYINMNKGG